MRTTRHSQKAVALIVVMAFLVLISALVVTFYSRVGTDLATSRSYAEGVNVRQLADSAVGVVMGQIREATTVPSGAWASQPGMIRVYGNGKDASPDAYSFYKLYSSHDLIVSREELGGFDPSEFNQTAVAKSLEVPLGQGGWREQPAFFTDLNEPTLVETADSRGRKSGRKQVRRYPIFDPSVAWLHEPGVTPPPGKTPWKIEGSEIVLPENLMDQANPAPMPVRWIYVLRDGTLTAPTPIPGPAANGAGFKAKWQALSGDRHGTPTKDNPLVGRIAFWADDDTSKVNINTGGGFVQPPEADEETNLRRAMSYAGSYWDTPRMQTVFDQGKNKTSAEDFGQVELAGLANCQPVANEFQRYPGHLSTTSLGLVFKELLKPETGMPAGARFDSEKLYHWLPRLTPGGSLGGSVRFDTTVGLSLKSAKELDIKGKTYHLFGSVDEMLYSPENGERELAESALGLPEDTITAGLLDRSRFFLTAQNHAPELNLFGRPRVTVWPIWNEPADPQPEDPLNNGTDMLIRFCSTIGGREFIFSRKDPYSATTDFNFERNRTLFNYLHELTSNAKGRIPGFGGSFEAKFSDAPGGRDQILAEIFDYIRTLNLKDTTRFGELDDAAAKERYMYAPRGIVVPTRAEVDDRKVTGFGRFPTISEATIVFYHAGWVGRPKMRPTAPEELIQDPEQLNNYLVTDKLVRAFLVFETFNPMQGYASTSTFAPKKEKLIHELELGRDFTIQSPGMREPAPLKFPKKADNQILLASGATWNGRSYGGTEGFFHTMRDKTDVIRAPQDDPIDAWPVCTYPFRTEYNEKGGSISGVRVPLMDKTFNFSGGKADLKIKFNGQTVQSIELDFPAGNNWMLPRGLLESERRRLEQNPAFPRDVEPSVSIATQDALWLDLGGFARDLDITGQASPATRKPRPAVRREWAFSFERRLSWMVSSAGRNVEQSEEPWKRASGGDDNYYKDRWRNILQPGDTIRSLVVGSKDKADETDLRTVALSSKVRGLFHPHPSYAAANARRAQTLRTGSGAFYFTETGSGTGSLLDLAAGQNYVPAKGPDLPLNFIARRADGKAADFDTGLGNSPDGAYCGKADEGNLKWRWFDEGEQKWKFTEPYFNTQHFDQSTETQFSANRQMPGAVMFGSLLSRGTGWETLCFSPNPAGGSHRGLTSPRDHLLLDLFTMPVVEPFAISEPFSTAGKVNLNYPIAPFSYLKRTTALRAALHPLRITAIPQNKVAGYKGDAYDRPLPETDNFRYLVDRNETLRAFDDFFDEYKTNRSKGFFKSASEICDRFLYPKGETHAGRITYRNKSEQTIQQGFWAKSTLTGDNLREKPYADLYPRVTTKSNTFTVHYRVQTLRQRAFNGKGNEAEYYASWDENRDSVVSELRGQTAIERYLDSADKRFTPQHKGTPLNVDKDSLEDAYRFRILGGKRFSPW